MTKYMLFAVLFFLGISYFSNTFASVDKPKSFWQWDTITGDWWGARQDLADKGVNFEFVYTGEVAANTKGGLKTGATYLDNLDLSVTMDMEKIAGWKGATFFVYGLGNWGGNPTEWTGDAQGASNIESPNSMRLHEAWIQQNFSDDKLSILVGLYDTNSEFDALETGAFFLNSSHGMGPDYSQAGLNGVGAFPATGLAGRILAKPCKGFYFQTMGMEGTPQDPNNPKSPLQIQFDDGEGVFIANELGYLTQDKNEEARYGKFAVGGWVYTAKFDDLLDVDGAGNPVKKSGNFGIYGLGEYNIYREKNNPQQGLNVFLRTGYANPNMNQFTAYLGVGAVYTGLIPKRDEDKLGLAVATAFNGNKFKRAAIAAGARADSVEVNVELSYHAQITPWLAVQPDVQYIVNPGTDPTVKNALYVGSRFELVF